MLTLPMRTRLSYSVASSSRTGATCLQGPHHSAQKSTTTGSGDLSTSCSKLALLSFTMLSAVINQWLIAGDDPLNPAQIKQPDGRANGGQHHDRRSNGQGLVELAHAGGGRHIGGGTLLNRGGRSRWAGRRGGSYARRRGGRRRSRRPGSGRRGDGRGRAARGGRAHRG